MERARRHKCYQETYRFSEDLDFTVMRSGPEMTAELLPIFARVSEWLRTRVGLELQVEPSMVRRSTNRRGTPTTTIRVPYRGPRSTPTLPKVKIDLTSDEVLVGPLEVRSILHAYSDAGELRGEVPCYSLAELLGEKIGPGLLGQRDRGGTREYRPTPLFDRFLRFAHAD